MNILELAWLWSQRSCVLAEKAKHVLETQADLSAARRKVLRWLEGSPELGVDETDNVGSAHTSWIVETINRVLFFDVQGALVVEKVTRLCLADAPADCRHKLREPVEVHYSC